MSARGSACRTMRTPSGISDNALLSVLWRIYSAGNIKGIAWSQAINIYRKPQPLRRLGFALLNQLMAIGSDPSELNTMLFSLRWFVTIRRHFHHVQHLLLMRE